VLGACIALFVVPVLAMVIQQLRAPSVGDECTSAEQCPNPGYCLQSTAPASSADAAPKGYCSRRCNGDKDCPEGMRCGNAALARPRSKTGATTNIDVCIR